MKGVSKDVIKEAEDELSLSFANDYKDYLMEFGVACANGHELTGITNSKRLNVVDVTQNARKKNPSVADELYVVEDTGIDKTLIWQDKKGRLFQTVGSDDPTPIKESLADYINL